MDTWSTVKESKHARDLVLYSRKMHIKVIYFISQSTQPNKVALLGSRRSAITIGQANRPKR
jgi:hypothetical protein